MTSGDRVRCAARAGRDGGRASASTHAAARPDRSRWKSALIALNVVAAAGTLLALAVAPTGTRMVVVAAPWSEPGRMMDIVTQAGGSLVNGGALDWIVVAEGHERGFAARLMAAGAVLVLDGRLAEACLKLGDYR